MRVSGEKRSGRGRAFFFVVGSPPLSKKGKGSMADNSMDKDYAWGTVSEGRMAAAPGAGSKRAFERTEEMIVAKGSLYRTTLFSAAGTPLAVALTWAPDITDGK